LKTYLTLGLFAFLACRSFATGQEELRRGLAETEQSFCADVGRLGIADAFLKYMAETCFIPVSLALTRSEYEAAVKQARAKAGASYKPGPNPNLRLVWSPSKVEVSDDGTLGYTWGRYDFTSKGKDGKAETTSGIYLTIWRRQADGSWKFVYDGGPQIPDDPKELVKFFARPDLPKAPN
jgi:Domain of unknown function (DUF4440)